jgi:putative DNA primase/helicase
VPRTGWHRDSFVFPDETIKKSAGRAGRAGQANGENVKNPSSKEADVLDVLDGEQIVLQVQTPHNPFSMAGSMENWKNTIGAWSRGNSRMMLAICASLAGSLLEPSDMESGGFNFVGGTSTGKTTALDAAGSVWGRGSSSGGYVQNWRATSNGLEGLASLHSDTLLALDEIGQAPGRTISEAAYMLANGMGKARAFQDGSAKNIRSWRCVVLSTGEKGLAEKLAEEGGRVQAGQGVRLVDVPADAGSGYGLFEMLHGHSDARAFSDAIKQAAVQDYGHAAREFTWRFVNEREVKQAQIHKALSDGLSAICPADAVGQVKRVARRFFALRRCR